MIDNALPIISRAWLYFLSCGGSRHEDDDGGGGVCEEWNAKFDGRRISWFCSSSLLLLALLIPSSSSSKSGLEEEAWVDDNASDDGSIGGNDKADGASADGGTLPSIFATISWSISWIKVMGGCTNLLLKLVESGENNNILVSSLSSLILVVVAVVVTEEDGIIVTSLFRDICLSVICRIGCVARRRCVCVHVCLCVCVCV